MEHLQGCCKYGKINPYHQNDPLIVSRVMSDLKNMFISGVVAHTFMPSTREAEARGSL